MRSCCLQLDGLGLNAVLAELDRLLAELDGAGADDLGLELHVSWTVPGRTAWALSCTVCWPSWTVPGRTAWALSCTVCWPSCTVCVEAA